MIDFFSKGSLLHSIKDELSFFRVPKLLLVSCEKWSMESDDFLVYLQDFFKSGFVVVRSSAIGEDAENSSLAGEYDSVLNVNPENTADLKSAINRVISSYKEKGSYSPKDEVIVQEMVHNSTMSGVIFTHDLNTGAPYYVVNYDDQSGLTDTVTSGDGEYANRTLYIHRKSTDSLRSERFIKLLQAVQELELVMESQFLDIEFALGEDLVPYLLQVRAITTQPNWNRPAIEKVDKTLQNVQQIVAERFKRLDKVYGETTILGQMPDWNPVEMIGRAPRSLAASLYKRFITDDVWRIARKEMGYATPAEHPLMIMLAGQPFIDTRLSFHSYIPDNVPSIVAEKIVNHWLSKLKSVPELHDKVEFEVAITTFSFDIDSKIDLLIGDALTASEKKDFKCAHLRQTKRLIQSDSLNKALDRVKSLNSKQNKQTNKGVSDISLLPFMASDCIQYGTIPFSILARHGFIARTLLLSLQNLGIMTEDEVDRMQATIKTIAGDLVDDICSFQDGKLTNAELMLRYGHLRPGTYDIMSHRYDQMEDIFTGKARQRQLAKAKPFIFSERQRKKVDALLIDNGFGDFKSKDLLAYIREATIAREYAKFVFTRTISDMLETIAFFAEKNGLNRSEISHVPFDSILKVLNGSEIGNIENYLRDISKLEKEKHEVSIAVRLPQILIDQASVHIIPFQVSHPNFITHKKVTAQCVMLDSKARKQSLDNKIIIVEGADPGFDWIFSQKIAGLITKYGGVNSHMAIRCAEFGIPAAIGCGEQYFDRIFKSGQVHLDCSSGLINSLD